MVYNIRIFSFIYVMIVIFSSFNYAPWKGPPIVPENPDELGYCFDWLIYHGFEEHNASNYILSFHRERDYDQDAFYYAAAFAFLLDNTSEMFSINEFGITEFCELHTLPNVNYKYIALKNAEFTCQGWIDLYLYSEERNEWRDYNSDAHINNYHWAMNRNKIMDNKISLLASLYFQYITYDISNELITPEEFCILMHKPVINGPLPKKYPFMTIDGSRMSCDEWEYLKTFEPMSEHVLAERYIKDVDKLPFKNIATECYEMIIAYGFFDDSSVNYIMISSGTNLNVDEDGTNLFARYYINYVTEEQSNRLEYELQLQNELNYQLRMSNRNQELIDQLYLEIDSLEELENTLMSPYEFCNSTNIPEEELLNQFGLI